MKRYVALLRGINISGKNKIPMAELKKEFEKLAFEEVKTYLNSGNVIFSSNENDTKKFANQIEGMIKNQFELEIPVFVIFRRRSKCSIHSTGSIFFIFDRSITCHVKRLILTLII